MRRARLNGLGYVTESRDYIWNGWLDWLGSDVGDGITGLGMDGVRSVGRLELGRAQ